MRFCGDALQPFDAEQRDRLRLPLHCEFSCSSDQLARKSLHDHSGLAELLTIAGIVQRPAARRATAPSVFTGLREPLFSAGARARDIPT